LRYPILRSTRSHLAQHAAQRLLGDGDTELLENPLAKIDDSPAHDPMNRRDRSVLQDRRQRRQMLVVQPRRLPFGLAIDQPVGTMRVEPEHPVADNLQPDAADPRRLSARGPVVDRCQSPSSLRACGPSFDRLAARSGTPSKSSRSPTAAAIANLILSAMANHSFDDSSILLVGLHQRGLV
jgi:hypothetical protein